MKETASSGCQILSDGNKVWVNGVQGESVARLSCFGRQVMIDIHKPLVAQRADGECLDCRHDLRGADAWRYFVKSLKRNFNVKVGEAHRPDWAGDMRKKRTASPTPSEVELRTKIVEFVRARSFRTELSIINYIMDKLRLDGFHISSEEALYQLARCVEDGPLMWFGADESKLGPDKVLETPMRYRYDPNVSMQEKTMAIEGQAEIETLCALYRRLKKKGRPVEPVVEALNRLGARRPKRQRFSVTYNPNDGQLTIRAKHVEWLPIELRRSAAYMILEIEQKESAEA